MREIVLDTETTGMDPDQGDRLVEIGCVELINQIPTGRTYHQYINPERDVPADAVAVHGLTNAFLAGYPTFAEVVDAFLEFIGDDKLVIHNAAFDVKFLNAELGTCGFKAIAPARVTDTLLLARTKFPGAPASLDALCRRFEIDNSNRTLHGALLDSELLAEVYLELLGGRQKAMAFDDIEGGETTVSLDVAAGAHIRAVRGFAPSAKELAAHAAMLGTIKNAMWGKD